MSFFDLRKLRSSALFHFSFFLFPLLITGCFNEPEPAYKSVPAEHRVYLSDKGLKALPQVNAKIIKVKTLEQALQALFN